MSAGMKRMAMVSALVLALGSGMATSARVLAQTPATPPAAQVPTPATPTPATPAPPATAQPAPPAATQPAAPVPAADNAAADPFGQEITLSAANVLIRKGNGQWDTAWDTLVDSFKKLFAFAEKNGLKVAGAPLTVYTSTDDGGFTFLAELPVEPTPGKTLPAGEMSLGLSPAAKALKFVHRGSYDNMDNTYEAITNHLDDKRLEAQDLFIEEYVTDPVKTPEDKLVINVYVPLKP